MDGSNATERDFVARVRAAQERLRGRVSPTVLIPMTVSVGDGEVEVTVAYEGHQEPGSFLFRAAYLSVLDAPPDRTIVCASRGNSAAAVACAARREGRKAVLFVPETTPRVTLMAIGRQGPHELRRVAGSIRDTEQAARRFARTCDAHFVSRLDEEWGAIAAGTLAAEILAEVPDVTDCLVPTGGGNLHAGMAEYFGDRLRVASVETEKVSNRVMTAKPSGSITVSVSDDAARSAVVWLWTHHDLPADIGAAAPLAALMENRYVPGSNDRTVVVVSGSNVHPNRLKGH